MNGISTKIRKALGLKNISINFLNSKLSLLLILIMIVCMVCGSICINYINLNSIKKLDILFLTDFDTRSSQKELYTFISSFTSLFLFWIILIMSALSFLGSFMVTLVFAFRCWGLGLLSGYIYLIYGLKGIAFYILVLLPGIFVSSVAFIFMTANSIKFSLKVSKKFLPNPDESALWNEMILYLKKSGYILIILMIASIIDMAFMKMFSKLFVF